MPHKHKRREKDSNTYDLPPTLIAKPLPTRDPKSAQPHRTKGKAKPKTDNKKKPQTEKFETKRKNGFDDDTPKAFKRLMQFQASRQQPKTKPSSENGLDSGTGGEGRKRKRGANDSGNGPTGQKKEKPASTEDKGTAAPKTETPKILPGEKLSDFAARVDRELPLADMKKSAKPNASGLEDIREGKQTKHEKRLRRLQREWREEEATIREREEEEREEREANMEDELQLWKQWETEAGKNKKKKGAAAKKNKRKNPGRNGSDSDSEDDDPDPWAKLNKRDRTNRPINPFDVAQAPPQLTKPKGKFKVRGGAKVDVANVPAAVGSLRRREELASERRNIVEEYRRLMAEKRK